MDDCNHRRKIWREREKRKRKKKGGGGGGEVVVRKSGKMLAYL